MKSKFKEFFDRATVFALVVTMLFSVSAPVQVWASVSDVEKVDEELSALESSNFNSVALVVPESVTQIENISAGDILSGYVEVIATVDDDFDNLVLTRVVLRDQSNSTVVQKLCPDDITGTEYFSERVCLWDSTVFVDGDYHLRLRSKDGDGNILDHDLLISIDNTAPATPVNGLPNDSVIPTNDFYFTWDAVVDNSLITYEYQASLSPDQVGGVLISDPWKSGILNTNSIHSSGALALDGKWYWQVRATDAAGNVSPWSAIWNVTLDTKAPTVDIMDPTQNQWINGVVDVMAKVEDKNLSYSSLEIIEHSTGEIKYTTLNSTISFDGLSPYYYQWDTNELAGGLRKYPDGEYRLRLTAFDLAGNVAVDIEKPVRVDNSSPMTTHLLSGVVDNGVTKTDVMIDLTSLDGGIGVGTISYVVIKDGVPGAMIDVDVSTLSPAKTALVVSGEGEYVIEYRGKDSMSSPNIENWQSVSFTIDTTKPVIKLNGVNPMDVAQGSVYIDPGCSATDASAVTCRALNPEVVDTSVVGASYLVKYEALDAAGNFSQDTRAVVVVPVIVAAATTVGTGIPAGEVAGETDEPQEGEVQGGLNEQNNDENNDNDEVAGMFGIAWYWWLIILVLVSGGSYWYFGNRRSKK